MQKRPLGRAIFGVAILGSALAVITASSVAASPAPPVHVDIPIHISSSIGYGSTLASFNGHLVVGTESNSGCQLATIQPTTLRINSNTTTSCNNPLLEGQDVMPVESITPPGSNFGEVRISVRNQATGSFRLGPVVMKYGNFSDSRPEWIYGGGYLWIYDVGTESDSVQPKLPPEVVRISLASGKVLDTVQMPPLTRITLAANADGLWFAPSQETGVPAHTATPALLYFLPLTAKHPTAVQRPTRPNQYVNWLVASGHTAWLNVATNPTAGIAVMETFQTPSSRPVTVTDTANTPTPSDIGEGPFDAPAVVYASGFGLVAAIPGWFGTTGTGGAQSERIVKLDPTTGRFSAVATFKTAPAGIVEANTVSNGALYLLLGGTEGSTVQTLYRFGPFRI